MTADYVPFLNQTFGLAEHLRFAQRPDGLVGVAIQNKHGRGYVSLYGGQVLDWTPTGCAPVLWLSPKAVFAEGKPIRGGVPICWPWFGPHKDGAAFPPHGFARTSFWQVVKTEILPDESLSLVLGLNRAGDDLAAEVSFTFGASLAIGLLTRNKSENPVTLAQALHAYFRVGDVRRVTLEGLAGCAYLDQTEGGRRKVQEGSVGFSGEVDRVYQHHTQKDGLIYDPVLKRNLRLATAGSTNTIVWNPGKDRASQMPDLGADHYATMLCVESGHVADDAVRLPAGGECRLWTKYSLADF